MGWKNKYNWIDGFLSKYRHFILLYVSIELIGIGLGLGFVWFSKESIDEAITVHKEELWSTLTLVVFCLLGNIVSTIYSSWLSERYKIKMLNNLQSNLKDKMMQWEWRSIYEYHTGDLYSRFKTDSEEVIQFLGLNLWQGIINIVRCISAAAFLFVFDPMLAISILIITPILLISKFYYKKIRNLTYKLRENEGEVAQITQDNLRMRFPIRALHLLENRMNHFNEALTNNVGIKLDLLAYSTFSKSILFTVLNVGFLLTFIWGVWSLSIGTISFGVLTAYLQLLARIQSPAIALISIIPVFIRFNTSLSRILEIDKLPLENSTTQYRLSTIEGILLDNVCFAYTKQALLKNLNLNFKKGQATALIGKSGQGKSTLLKIISSQIDPGSGSIWINSGNELIQSSINYRINFTYVSQDDQLFRGSILENLKAANFNSSIGDIHKVLRITCSEFVYLLPNGLETIVGESGLGLSEGQMQRLIIARAILRESSVWLFDEITSALDPDTSRQVIENLLNEGSDKIVLFATHDQLVIDHCDQVIALERNSNVDVAV